MAPTRKVLIKSHDGAANVGYNFILQEKPSWIWNQLQYKGSSVFTGFNLGDQSTFNIGLRGNYGIGDSVFELMPEAYLGLGNPVSYGVHVNGIFPFTVQESMGLKAYVGTGGGILHIDGETNGTFNLLIGSYVNLLNGRVFVDYTARNIFGNNMFSIGYRLPF